MWTGRQGFTASKHLWDATSSVEFYRAWREKPQYWIENLGFKDFWMYGRAADLDDFTRLMLTSCVADPLLRPIQGVCLLTALQARRGRCHGSFHGGRHCHSNVSTA